MSLSPSKDPLPLIVPVNQLDAYSINVELVRLGEKLQKIEDMLAERSEGCCGGCQEPRAIYRFIPPKWPLAEWYEEGQAL